MREAQNYLNKINNIDFGPSIEPKAILKYLNIFFNIYVNVIFILYK